MSNTPDLEPLAIENLAIEPVANTFLQTCQLADNGDVEAQYQTGLYYAQGMGVPQNYQKAGEYWLIAAKQSHPAAQTHLGVLFEKGLGFVQDYAKALHCYQSAADLEYAEALVRLAMLYLSGLGTSQNVKKAVKLFMQAAQKGEAVAQYNLAAAYEKGLGGLKQNADLAQFWYQQAANQQHPQALEKLQLAESAAKQLAEPLNFSDEDLPTTPTSDAVFAQGVAVIQTDLPTAFNFFEQAALLGHAKAQYNMGLALLYGLGGKESCTDTAIEWLEKSANQSYRPAYLVLGWLYQGGNSGFIGVNDIDDTIIIDYSNAISQYEMASELGHAQAQYFLAHIYATGNGTAVDEQKAVAWFKQSAKHGYFAAAKRLNLTVPN